MGKSPLLKKTSASKLPFAVSAVAVGTCSVGLNNAESNTCVLSNKSGNHCNKNVFFGW